MKLALYRSRRSFYALLFTLGCAHAAPPKAVATASPAAPHRTEPARAPMLPAPEVRAEFDMVGHTRFGNWSSHASMSAGVWHGGDALNLDATLRVPESNIEGLVAAKKKVKALVLLVTAERTFDMDGMLRFASDERQSTLLTPTGLAIEGGIYGAATNRFGYGYRTPVDELVSVPLEQTTRADGSVVATFRVRTHLPADLPPGIYRLRLDYGAGLPKRIMSLDGERFAMRSFEKGDPVQSYAYSPPVPASGKDVKGRAIDATKIRRHTPWILLSTYNSNGYRGVVADEDRTRIALSNRNIIPDDVILPLNDDHGAAVLYNLAPSIAGDDVDPVRNLPWKPDSGSVTIDVTGPDGKTEHLGTAPVAETRKGRLVIRYKPFNKWRPPSYGQYTVRVSGYTEDTWGNRYEGGGTYRFWIAHRMTLATATFQGVSYPVGASYGRDLAFSPPVPAEVEVVATLYPGSDPARARSVRSKGTASRAGLFGMAQGMKPLPLDAAGEYEAHIVARYTDRAGQLWVSSMRHAGVVYPADSGIVAHGKRLKLADDQYVERGETHREGWDRSPDDKKLDHINYPYAAHDVLVIASEHQKANKVVPVLTYENKSATPSPHDGPIQGTDSTNIRFATSNGYSPHLFPEYITDREYFYASAPRPGFMGRFLVAEDGTRAPYWPTSPHPFGDQIGTAPNGDVPGTIYRLLGGVVVQRAGAPAEYAPYLASCFIVPGKTKNNRVVAPGAEDLPGPSHLKARFFLVSARPGSVYEVGSPFVPFAQIDPVVPATVTFRLRYPSGKTITASAVGDASGVAIAADRPTLDEAGVYRLWVEGTWNGHRGVMPGLPRDGGAIYVIERERSSDAPALALELASESVFDAKAGLKITGTSSATRVEYAAVIPGSALMQGSIPVNAGHFTFALRPETIHALTPTYETTDLKTGKPELGGIVHLTFFSTERAKDGSVVHDFARVVVRGNQAIYVH